MNYNYQKVFIAFAVCIVLALSSCNDPNIDGSETYSYTIYPQKQLVIDTTNIPVGKDSSQTLKSITTEAGDNLVFKYRYNKMAAPNVADGGFSETVYFEVPADKEKINLKDSDLQKALVYYTHSCFCPRIGALEITDGTIKGEKLSPGRWYISSSLNINFPGNQSGSRNISFKHLFRQK